MKKALVAIPLCVISFGLLMAAIGALVPREYQVERTRFIEGDPDEIFAYIEDLETWPKWAYWTPQNVDGLEVSLGDITSGKGATHTWTENGIPGQLTIVEHEPNATPMMIKTEMRFGDFPKLISVVEVESTKSEILDENGKVTRVAQGAQVTWKSTGKVNADPISGWFGILMPSMVGVSYDYGLNRLNELCGKQQNEQTKPTGAGENGVSGNGAGENDTSGNGAGNQD